MKNARGFTLIELIVVVAILVFVASVTFAGLTGVRLGAHDKHRIDDLEQLEKALNLYANDHNYFPRESDGANGNIATNKTLRTMLEPYMKKIPADPINDANTFYYYYDGAHRCGDKIFAVVFARQMERPENANYDEFLNTTCSGILDGEGRGGGTESYNIIVGLSGG